MSILKLKGNDSGTGNVTLEAPNTNTDQTIAIPDGAGSFVTANASGDVGIGTSSPNGTLTVRNDSTNTEQLILGNSTNTGGRDWRLGRDNVTTGDFIVKYSDATNSNVTTEAMRISGGNLLVGKTSANSDNAGFEANSTGFTAATRDNGTVFVMDRLTSDGQILSLRKDNSSIAGIGVLSSDQFYLARVTGSQGIKFRNSGAVPCNSDGSDSDNDQDLGLSAVRWNDAYITNGVTTGSDANEKQQIAVLTDAEIAAAKRISAGFKTFKWNDAVEAKGDNARTHTGVIAQEVQTALEAEGLDAGNYAFWMSNTWWETQTEVPAVEAVDEVVDEDGNVITEAVEAQEAYTRTDTYDTLEEAPENATERTRLGIRYPELLAFIGAATEQRLASIEARLDALEAV